MHSRLFFRDGNRDGPAARSDIGALHGSFRKIPVNPRQDMRTELFRLRARNEHILIDNHLVAIEPRIPEHMTHRLLLQNPLHACIKCLLEIFRHFFFIMQIQVVALFLAQLHEKCHDGFRRNIILLAELLIMADCF